MCGFVGYFTKNLGNELAQDLATATDTLGHRGPDGRGVWKNTELGIGLGHRRLSIIDLTDAGRQPMQSTDGRFMIVYNGEVYNFIQLRKELQGFGYEFFSQTDTEVVLNAFRHWGSKCLERFIGMFAFAILDLSTGKLFLARDRLGIKPLFYYQGPKCFLFASELKALMAFKQFPRSIRHSGLRLFLHYQYVPAPETIFEGTFKLLPGHWLEFDINKPDTLVSKPYWSIDGDKAYDGTWAGMDECVDKLDELLTRAVADRLISDVPLGALLSGGIDSSLVAAIMQKVNGGPVKTFSIGFQEADYNEAPYARAIAKHLGTDHTELYVTPDQALSVIPKLAEIYDEPFADSSAIPTHLVSLLTREQVKVALTGDGGDEQFAGYVRYWMTNSLIRAGSKFPPEIRHVLAKVLALMPETLIRKTYRLLRPHLPQRFQVTNFRDKWQKLILIFAERNLAEIYRATICVWSGQDLESLLGKAQPESNYDRLFRDWREVEPMRLLMRVDQRTYLPDCMLTKVDRASMAAGLEVRVPLLDHRVVAFSSSIPLKWLYNNGSGKLILKALLKKYLPPVLFERPKMGFGVPISHWLRNELREMVMDFLSPDVIKQEGVFDSRKVQAILSEHMQGKNDHHHRIWALLMWQMWRKRWTGWQGQEPE